MSYDKIKINIKEVDELNIKSHLNTSLEAEGISVSEDLINRTLEAIKSDNDQDVELDKAPVFMSGRIRTLVTVVETLLILAVGINAIRLNIPYGMMLDNATDQAKSYDNTTDENDMAFSEASDQYDDSVDGIDSYNLDAYEFTTNTEDAGKDTSVKYGEATVGALPDNEVEDKAELTVHGYEMTFTEMVLIESEAVKSITITSILGQGERAITGHDEVKEFYWMMDNYIYQQGSGDYEDMLYTVDIIGASLDGRLLIGDSNIVVELTNKDAVSQSIYTASDHGKLIEEMKNFIND